MKSFALIFLGCAFLSACGSSSPSDANNPGPTFPPTPDNSSLQVGSSSENLADTNVNFAPVHQGKQFKTLRFTAAADGKLSVSDWLVVDGSNCDGDPKNSNRLVTMADVKFKILVSIFVKDPKTGDFTVVARHEAASSVPTYSVQAGDEVKIHVELDSPVNCESASTSVSSAFSTL